MRNAAIILGMLVCLGAFSFARTITISPDGSGEYATIQAAVDAAVDGDLIVLADGVYSGEGNWRATVNKSVTIRSAGGRDVCSIEGVEGFDEIAGLIVQAPGKHVAIEGLALRNGSRGLRCVEGRATITNCIVENNKGGVTCGVDTATIQDCFIRNNRDAGGYYGGIYSLSRSLQVVNCVIEGNQARLGGGVYAGGSTRISRCIIKDNSALGGGGVWFTGVCEIDDSLIVKNRADNSGQGGGIYCEQYELLVLTNSVVADNEGGYRGGGMYLGYSSIAHLKNSVVHGNQASSGSQFYVSGATVQADHCIMPTKAPGLYSAPMSQVFLGEGVRDIDPGFVDAAGGDYRLRPDSPCVDAGSNDFTGERLTEDAAGQERVLDWDGDGEAVVDIGAYELLPAGEKVIRASAQRIYFTQIGGVLDETSQAVRIWAEGGDLRFTSLVEQPCTWLMVSPTRDTVDAEGVEATFAVMANTFAPGTYTCDVVISGEGALNEAEIVTVVLYVVPEAGYWVPFHYATIQAALDACPEGGTVIVADGEYGGGIVFPERPVVLKSATGPEHCRINGQGFVLENVRDGCRLDGFTVAGSTYMSPISVAASSATIAKCRIRCNAIQSGRAIACADSQVELEGCTIEYNTSGVRANGGNTAIRGCTIRHNAQAPTETVEGAVHVMGGATTLISDCTISDNICVGVCGYGEETIKVSDCLIRGNGIGVLTEYGRLELSDSVLTGNAGGLESRYEGVTEIRNCTIAENDGRGVCVYGGRTLNISDSAIRANVSYGPGGGVSCFHGVLLMNNCVVHNNATVDIGTPMGANGGGISAYECAAVRIIDSVVSGNTSQISGGGVYFRCAGCPAGLEENFVLENCLLSGNTAVGGYGGGFQGGGELFNCTLVGNRSLKAGSGASMAGRIVNCILQDNVCGVEPQVELYARPGIGEALRVEYCDFPGGVAEETAYDDRMSGVGNMDADALFAAAGYWDDGGTPADWEDDVWVEGDYHLMSAAGRWDAAGAAWVYDDVTSPCVDAGDPASEWCGELWPHGGRINMGAYGGTWEASMSLSAVGDVGDLDCDAEIGFGDFGVLAMEWNAGDSEKRPFVGDLDRDGVVGLSDLAVFAEGWASE